jgi:hypothetical protein
MWATSEIFKKQPKVNIHPLGENSPNLVTLLGRALKIFGHFSQTSLVTLSLCESLVTLIRFRTLSSHNVHM